MGARLDQTPTKHATFEGEPQDDRRVVWVVLSYPAKWLSSKEPQDQEQLDVFATRDGAIAAFGEMLEGFSGKWWIEEDIDWDGTSTLTHQPILKGFGTWRRGRYFVHPREVIDGEFITQPWFR